MPADGGRAQKAISATPSPAPGNGMAAKQPPPFVILRAGEGSFSGSSPRGEKMLRPLGAQHDRIALFRNRPFSKYKHFRGGIQFAAAHFAASCVSFARPPAAGPIPSAALRCPPLPTATASLGRGRGPDCPQACWLGRQNSEAHVLGILNTDLYFAVSTLENKRG